jgi:hypothetical protein
MMSDVFDQIRVCEIECKFWGFVLVSSSLENLESLNSMIRVQHSDTVVIFRWLCEPNRPVTFQEMSLRPGPFGTEGIM